MSDSTKTKTTKTRTGQKGIFQFERFKTKNANKPETEIATIGKQVLPNQENKFYSNIGNIERPKTEIPGRLGDTTTTSNIQTNTNIA